MVRRQQAADWAIRPKSRSPGHPKLQRHVEVAFWEQIAKGLLAEEAAGVIGLAQAVGARSFHNAGGMPPFDLKFKPTGRCLAFTEREEIALLRAAGKGVREIARAIGGIGRRSRSGRRTLPPSGRRSRSWSPPLVARERPGASRRADPPPYPPVALHPGAGRSETRARLVPAHRAGVTGPAGAITAKDLGTRHSGNPDQ